MEGRVQAIIGQRQEWIPVTSWLGWMGLHMYTRAVVDTIVPPPKSPGSLSCSGASSTASVAFLPKPRAVPLFQGLRVAVCQDKLEVVGIASPWWGGP